MLSPTVRAALALALFSGWMALLFWGFAFGGAVHLLLAAGLALFPWRAAAAPPSGAPGD
jgi:membrane protein required for beta-lactamase induction